MTLLLTKEESELSALQSIVRMGTRETLEEKIDKTIYDKEAEHETIILNKILPLLARVYFYLVRKTC